jgi:hypothetical protein
MSPPGALELTPALGSNRDRRGEIVFSKIPQRATVPILILKADGRRGQIARKKCRWHSLILNV